MHIVLAKIQITPLLDVKKLDSVWKSNLIIVGEVSIGIKENDQDIYIYIYIYDE